MEERKILNSQYKQVTALILSYEPVPVIIDLAKNLYNCGFNVLIVNDGSSEKFNPIFKECEKYAEILSYSKNHGKGYAIKYGIAYLLQNKKNQKYALTVDGDGQHSIKDCCRVADALIKDNKIVIGVRMFEGKVPFRSRFGNDWSKFTQSLVTGKYLRDNQCGLRGFVLSDSEWLLSVAGNRYEYEMNVISKMCMKDYDYEELEIETIYEKGNPTSHFKPFLDTCKIQGILLKSGVFSILSWIIQLAIFIAYLYLLGPNQIDIKEPFRLILSLAGGNVFGFLTTSFLNTVYFRPTRRYYHTLKALVLNLCELVLFGSALMLLSYLVKLNPVIVILLATILALFPTFFVVKAISLLKIKKIKKANPHLSK